MAPQMQSQSLSDTSYRHDVDGMRAVAVMAVIAYHVDPAMLPGGYLGVDVFFVISGYVITRVLLREYALRQTVDLLAFWERRVRRLAPALLLVLAGVLLASPLLLERISGEVGVVAQSTLAVLLLNLNHFLLMRSGDYFSELSEHNPLLHLWSLSVEEQFYLFWPALLILLIKLGRRGLVASLALLIVASLYAHSVLLESDSAAAFFLMPTRAWELLLGAMVAVGWRETVSHLSQRLAPSIGMLGLFIVFFCLFAGPQLGARAYLSNVALAGGTAMMITSGTLDIRTVFTRVMGSRPLRYLGKISYPLYLWHWPILVITRSNRLYDTNLLQDLWCVLLAMLLAILTFEWLEKPVGARGLKKLSALGYGVVGAALVASLALLLGAWARFGWWYNGSERLLDASRRDRPDTGCMFNEYPTDQMIDACFPNRQETSVLLWGDSHAEHWAPALAELGRLDDVDIGVLTMSACRPLPAEVRGGDCGKFNAMIMARIDQWRVSRGLRGVVLAARWSDGMGAKTPSVADQAVIAREGFYDVRASNSQTALLLLDESLRLQVAALTAQGVRVLIVQSSPIQKYAAQHCLARLESSRCYVTRKEMDQFSSQVDRITAMEAARRDAVRAIDPSAFMCNHLICPATINGVIVYSDDDHVTAIFSRNSAKYFSEYFHWLHSP